MAAQTEVCTGFIPNPSISYTNCTMSWFISNWTECCCQPIVVKNTKFLILSIISILGIIGTVCNIISISSFLYLYSFPERIRIKFGQEFSMLTKDPVFLIILHLSFCNLLYCIGCLPSYWIEYYYGYYPYSQAMCKFSAFFRISIGNRHASENSFWWKNLKQ